MNTSLTVVLPVYNAEDRLADQVERLLDVLPEMSRRFEIVIVDDGSIDDTPDVAHELAMYFPQVNLVRHPVRLGLEEAIQTGLDASQGEVVFVGDEQYGIAVDDLQRLWQLHEDQNLIVARRKQPPAPTNWIGKLLARSQRQSEMAGARLGVQMIRRDNLNAAPGGTGAGIALTRRIDASNSTKPTSGPTIRPNVSRRSASDEPPRM